MTLSRLAVLLGATVLIPAGILSAAPVDIQPGEWETTTVTKVPGMPVDPPPQVQKTCLSESDLVPNPSQDQTCKLTETKITGNTVEWKVSCSESSTGLSGQGSGKITYSGTTFAGTMTLSLAVPGQSAMKLDSELSGRWLGSCTK